MEGHEEIETVQAHAFRGRSWAELNRCGSRLQEFVDELRGPPKIGTTHHTTDAAASTPVRLLGEARAHYPSPQPPPGGGGILAHPNRRCSRSCRCGSH